MNTPVRDRIGSIWQSFVDEFKYSTLDFGWVKTFFAYASREAATIAYRPEPAVFNLPEKCCIAMVGDFGTGTPEMTKVLNAIALFEPDIFLHLGDIYYSGTKGECQKNFLWPLNEMPGNHKVFSLCGNHDVYSGGAGYYWLLDTIGQKSSFFSLENKDLNIVAIDTGHGDYNPVHQGGRIDVHKEELAWAKAKLLEKKSILLSHHQPFSAYCNDDNGLIEQIGTNMDAWFWGHEHRLTIYNPYRGVERGRCVGAGAVPEFVKSSYFQQTSYAPEALPITYGHNGLVYKHSFAIMNIDGPSVTVRYFDEDVIPLYQETI